jgi:heme exporter protein B
VGAVQVVPFAVAVLVLFAFALNGNRATLQDVTPGLAWIAVLLSLLLAVPRAFGPEIADGALDALRLSGLEPAGVFLGKAGALAVQLLGLDALLVVGVAVFYGPDAPGAGGWVVLVTTAVVATSGLAVVGTLYGALAAGIRVRDTLLPLLVLPVVMPVLIGATRATEASLGIRAELTDAWPWVGLLAVFTLAYTALGLLAFGPLLEES